MRQAAFEAAHAEEWRAFERFLEGAQPAPFPAAAPFRPARAVPR